MMYSKKNEIVVGLIVVIAIIILIVGNILFTNSKLKRERYDVAIIFPEVGGLEVGNPVFVNGVRKGKVNRIDLLDNGVKVIISLSKDVRLFSDAKFSITEVGMMGEKQMKIYQGKADQVLDTSRKIQGEYTPGLGETLAEAKQAIKNINNLSAEIEKLFKNSKNTQTISGLIENLNNLSQTLNSFLNKSDKFTTDFSKISKITGTLDTIIVENKDKIDRIIAFTDTQLPEIEAMLIEIRSITSRLNNAHTDFGHFTSSDSLYNNLNQAVKNLDSLVIDIKKNPKKYFKVF